MNVEALAYSVIGLAVGFGFFGHYKAIKYYYKWREAVNLAIDQDRTWHQSWEEREREFNAILVNINVDPVIDPFTHNDGRPGAGDFAHLADNISANELDATTRTV